MTARRHLAWLALVGALLAGAAAPAAGAAAAAAAVGVTGTAAFRPDARIRLAKTSYEVFDTEKHDGPWIGDNVYNSDGSGQRAIVGWSDVTPGWQRWVFQVSLENDGSTSDRFRVQATGTDLAGWSVKYFDGTANVSAAVRSGTFSTPALAPGDTYVLKVKVTRSADEFDFDNLRRLITATSVRNPNKSDTVKLVLERFTCGC